MLIQITVVINYSLQGVWIVLQLIVATFLSIKVIKTKRYNIIPLILFFFISSLRIISFFMSPSFLIIFLIMVQFPNILLVIFTKLTFFKHKHKMLRTKGFDRAAVVKPTDLKFKFSDSGENNIQILFNLTKGSYATMFLREVLQIKY